MYDEVEYKINWQDKFKKTIIVLALILLIGFIILKLTNISKPKNNFFNDNMNTMVSVAKNFYQNNNTKDKITLREMIDKKMILDFYDENGQTCDIDNSYATIENNKIEVFLKCANQQKTEENYI